MRLLLSFASLLVAACADPEAQPVTPPDAATRSNVLNTAPSPASEEREVVESIEGLYRVAGVDGRDINLPHGITATIDGSQIEVHSQCVRFTWTYRFEGGRLITEPIPQVICQRAQYAEEQAIDAALTAAERVRRTAANGLEFSGGGHSITLFSQ